MSLKDEHNQYRKEHGKYKIDCDTQIFNHNEIEILEKYGHWFKALVDGTLEPFTESQKNFISVFNGTESPVSVEEKAWFKYLGRKNWEQSRGDRKNIQYSYQEEGFYTREDKKKMNKMQYSEMMKNHRS